ncbi:MAG: hypothetical protein ACRCYP_03545 [Alphaproteobacteria bacterium]
MNRSLFRLDKDGTPWTYHRGADTIAVFQGKEGANYRVRLPGEGSKTVKWEEILDPADPMVGGIERWATLKS